MDPVDQEKPWTALGQIALITSAIGVVYFMVRFAVVIPEWGWQLIVATTLVAGGLYWMLAFRRGPTGPPVERSAREKLLGALLIVALMLPLGVALYYALFSGKS